MHRITLLVSSLALALAACSSKQQDDGSTAAANTPAAPTEVELIPRDALFGNPERAGVQISPDGKYLSWIAPLEGVMNVWVAPANDLAAARAVTDDQARGIRNYFWSYRPDTLLYLRDSGGDEDFHLYSLDLESGEARDLTPFEKTTASVAGVSRNHPESILVGMNDRDAQWHDIYKVDLASGKRTLLEKNDAQIAGYIADAVTTTEFPKKLVITLKYSDKAAPAITEIKRVSKPGLRHYASVGKIPSVLDGMGLVILSTSKGVMSGAQAKKEKLGGEVICTVA